MTLFDYAEGAARRDAGIDAISDSKPKTVELVCSAIRFCAIISDRFTADDIREVLEANGVEVEHPNTIGAAFNRCARAGVIRSVGYKTAVRPSAHSRVVRVWEAA